MQQQWPNAMPAGHTGIAASVPMSRNDHLSSLATCGKAKFDRPMGLGGRPTG